MMLLRQRGENVYSGGEEPFYPTLRASGCDANPSVYSFVRFFNAVHSVMESPKVTSGTPNSDIACYQCTRCSIFSFFFSKYLCPQHQQHFKNIVKEMSTKLKGFTLVVWASTGVILANGISPALVCPQNSLFQHCQWTKSCFLNHCNKSSKLKVECGHRFSICPAVVKHLDSTSDKWEWPGRRQVSYQITFWHFKSFKLINN